MPVYERRFFLGMLTKKREHISEQIEANKETATKNNAKGTREVKISGKNLKNRINSGDIPLK